MGSLSGVELPWAFTYATSVGVTWPSSKEVYATTIVVILVSLFFGVYLFALDQGIGRAVEWIIHRFGGA